MTKELQDRIDAILEGKRQIIAPPDTDPDPSPKAGARKLRRYWTKGPGAAKIKWGTPGDFKRCVRHLRKYVGTGAEGLCNVYHRSAIGAPPGKGHKSEEIPLELAETLLYASTLLQWSVPELIKLDEFDVENKDDMPDLEYKNISTVSTGATETKDDGTVEALVSVTGVLDNVGDIIEPGAYEKTLQEMKPKGVWSHDWNTPVSRVEEVKELLPGDPALPKTLADGSPWPTEAGALYVKAQFNLDTQRGKEAFSDVKFFGSDTEWSIGYKVPKGGAVKDEKTGVRHIKTLRLYEYSPVLFGAASNARTLISAAKTLAGDDEHFLAEVKSVTDIEIAENTPVEIDKEELDLAADAIEEERAAEKSEVTTEERANAVEVSLTAESLAQIKSLHDQLGAVLEAITTLPTEKTEDFSFTSEKTMREAADALVEGTYDNEVVGAVNGYVKLLEKAIEKGDENAIKVYANDALDEIDFALQDEKADDPTKEDFKNLVAAIGKAIQNIEGTEEKSETTEEVEVTPIEEEKSESKTVSIDQKDWNFFLDSV